MSKIKPLTSLQHDFIKNYISNGGEAKSAALNAGYSLAFATTKAPDLLKSPAVKKQLNRLNTQVMPTIDKELKVTYKDRVKALSRMLYDILPEDETLPVRRNRYETALKIVAELNKMSGDYAPNKRLQITVDATSKRIKEASEAYEEF